MIPERIEELRVLANDALARRDAKSTRLAEVNRERCDLIHKDVYKGLDVGEAIRLAELEAEAEDLVTGPNRISLCLMGIHPGELLELLSIVWHTGGWCDWPPTDIPVVDPVGGGGGNGRRGD